VNFEIFFKYHMKTKHSYFSVRNNPNLLNWNNQPNQFKSYLEPFFKTKLNLEKINHRLIYYIAGITAKKTYPGVEYYLRVNPSAGALYPNELYFQSRKNKDFKDGIYHFDIASSSVTLLHLLENDDGLEPYFNYKTKQDGFIFLISSIYYRSSWKYKNRAFRYCLLDAGHLLGSIESSSYVCDKPYKIIYNFDKKVLNKVFNFDKKEFFSSSVFVSKNTDEKVCKVELNLPTVDGSFYFEKNIMIEEAYNQSLALKNFKNEDKKPIFDFDKKIFEQIILKRRSTREFLRKTIDKNEFETIMETISQAVPSDCDEKLDIYCVINRVNNMKLGLIKNGKYIKEGNFMSKAGYLCLEQDLGFSSSVTFFITSNSKNYQELYQKAGLMGHRLYLASNYLRIACSGIGAYYDDEVCEFLGEYSQVLYALAIGR